MNLLVRLFLEEPSLIDDLADGETVPFLELAERLPGGSEAAAIIRAVRDDPSAERQLQSVSYLQVLTAVAWDEALGLARHGGRSQAEEWVTMVAGRRGETGLTLPEDASPVRRVSLFGRSEGEFRNAVRRISIDSFRNSPWSLSISLSSGHCELPSQGICAPGQCGGCTRKLREAEPAGIVCVCGHRA